MVNRVVIIGEPGGRRITLFTDALHALGLPTPQVITYADVLDGHLDKLHLDQDTLLRLESPGGGDTVTTRRLLALGSELDDCIDISRVSHHQSMTGEIAHGRIFHPRQWYLGFRAALRQITTALRGPVMNHPEDVEVMFDKRLTHARCLNAGLPVPRAIGPVGSYDELRAQMRDAELSAVFVKIINGSSASGVVAYRAMGDRERAITSAELVREGGEVHLYNALRIRRYDRREDIAAVIDTLCQIGGVHVEAWLPKATLRGRPFDVRVVVVGGQARQFVARVGSSPMTNLHLGNSRGDPDILLTRIGRDAWARLTKICETSMELFPRSLYAGVDLMIHRETGEGAILEINAFGDLIPRVRWNGMETYETELRAFLKTREAP